MVRWLAAPVKGNMGVRGKSRTMMNSLMFATGVVVGFSLSLLLPSSHVHEANYQW